MNQQAIDGAAVTPIENSMMLDAYRVTEGTFGVRFRKTGKWYDSAGVPKEKVDGFIAATTDPDASVGLFYNSQIKGQYPLPAEDAAT